MWQYSLFVAVNHTAHIVGISPADIYARHGLYSAEKSIGVNFT